jgi:hypothetical protein
MCVVVPVPTKFSFDTKPPRRLPLLYNISPPNASVFDPIENIPSSRERFPPTVTFPPISIPAVLFIVRLPRLELGSTVEDGYSLNTRVDEIPPVKVPKMRFMTLFRVSVASPMFKTPEYRFRFPIRDLESWRFTDAPLCISRI